jgi:GT2 family glycosyltransferase
MSPRPVHAVIVAYHAAEQLDRCLDSLERQVPVTIVDNSSSDEVASVAKRHGAGYIDSGVNRGFAAGVNIGLERLAGKDVDVLLLNPDAVVKPIAIQELALFLHRPENAGVAAVVPRLSGPGDTAERVMWPFPTPARMWAEALGLGRMPARRRFVIGAVLLLRREAIDDVGLFDERFFLYAEEADWQWRSHARGWQSAVCVDAAGEHTGAGTSTSPCRRETLFCAAQETYIRKWYGTAGWWAYRGAACFGAGARTLIFTGERRRQAARRAVLYLRGPRRCATLE